MDKPKEFWILENGCAMPLRAFYSEEDSFDEMQINDNHIHVIEYSAYEQLQKKFDEAIKHLKFTFHAAEHVYQPDKPLHKGIDPTFYHTLTYEGDLKRIKQTNAAKEFLRSLDKEKK